MKIGISCYPVYGGSGVVATELGIELAKRGHEVHFITYAPPFRLSHFVERIFYHEVEVPQYALFEHPPYNLALSVAIQNVAATHGLDLLHAHYAVPHATSAWLAKEMLGNRCFRIITTLHGTDITLVGQDPSYHAITQFSIRRSDGITAVSEYLKRETVQHFAVEPERIRVIPNFVDLERFRPAPRDLSLLQDLFPGIEADAPVLAHVSNFRPVKRPTDLVEVLARVRRQLPARMLFVGDGPERVATEAHARALGLEGAVRFVGERADHAALLRQADLFVLTSEDESFGLAALEAMACGVPVVAYRVGGLEEVVGEDAGVLVDPFDPDALAEAALRILAGERASMASAARARAEHYRRAPAIDRYEALYARVMGGRG